MKSASSALLLMLAASVVACESMTYGGTATGNGQTAAAPPQDIPSFPWPPPKWSASCDLPVTLFAVQGRETRFGDVADRLEAALDDCGYADLAFYSAPGGFAIASQFEQINDDGTPKGGNDRWSRGIARAGGSFGAWFDALFTAVVGHYRVVVFVIVDDAVPHSAAAPSEEDADAWMESGLDRLPNSLRSRTFGPDHHITALIYEFKRPDGDKPVVAMNPSALSAKQHLERARLQHALGY
jgi:hypothetical protein